MSENLNPGQQPETLEAMSSKTMAAHAAELLSQEVLVIVLVIVTVILVIVIVIAELLSQEAACHSVLLSCMHLHNGERC